MQGKKIVKHKRKKKQLPNPYKEWLRLHWDSALVFVLVAYFAVRVVYFAFHIDHFIPPDEVTHLGRCELYAKSAMLPSNSPNSYALGLVGWHTPYLFYFIMGKLLHLKVFPVSNLIFLRLVSTVFGGLIVFYGWRWMRMFSPNRLVQVLFITMLTNTLMFTIMCSAVNCDSLTNLLAAMAVYYLTRFFKEQATQTLLVFWSFILAGSLTKITFLPLAFILALCLAVHQRHKLMTFPRELYCYLVPVRLGRLAGIGALLLLIALNMGLYGGNLVRFGKLFPSLEQVLSQEQIMQHSVAARKQIISHYRNGDLSFEQAMAQAKQIKLAADRRDTIALLKGYAWRKSSDWQFKPISRFRFGFTWCWLMCERTFGLLGHQRIYKEEAFLTLYMVIFLLAMAMFVRHWRPMAPENFETYVMAIVLFYTLFLMQFVGYQRYLEWEMMVEGLQGRYIFPVILPLYGLVARYLLAYWPKPVQVAGFLAASTVFIYGDFPFFLEYVAPVIF